MASLVQRKAKRGICWGEGYYQEKGKPIQVIKTGDVIEILPDIIHWHGATPYSGMEHIAIGTKASAGAAV
ncbi:MAG: hypothetical protein LBN27_09075 [Prevotellaceae bacterium]|nr:hypothetical protein [Prevotellaceae bacterium]